MRNINYYLLKELLHKNNYYFDEHQLESRLLSHPDFPNINSITDTLDEMDIENLAAEFPDKNPGQIQGSFLALVRQNENDFYVLAKKGRDKKIILFSNEGINHRQEIDENYFSSIWSGVAVLVEYNGTIRKFVNQKKFLLSAVIILLTLCPFLHGLSLFPVIHYFLSLTGAIISFFIFLKQAGYHSPLVEKTCSESKFTSCNTVLDAKALKLPLGLNLGDYSLVYFVSIIISIVTILPELQLIQELVGQQLAGLSPLRARRIMESPRRWLVI